MTLEEIQSLNLKEGDLILFSYTNNTGFGDLPAIIRKGVAYYAGLEYKTGVDEDDVNPCIYYVLHTIPICPNSINAMNSWVNIDTIEKLNKLEVIS